MGENAGKWGNSGHSTQDAGRGGMWRDLVEENGREMGETMGQNTHFSPSHSSHFSRGRNIFPANPFATTSPPHSPTEKWEFLPLTDTHRRRGSCGCLAMAPGYMRSHSQPCSLLTFYAGQGFHGVRWGETGDPVVIWCFGPLPVTATRPDPRSTSTRYLTITASRASRVPESVSGSGYAPGA